MAKNYRYPHFRVLSLKGSAPYNSVRVIKRADPLVAEKGCKYDKLFVRYSSGKIASNSSLVTHLVKLLKAGKWLE